MRLAKVSNGHTWANRFKLMLFRVLMWRKPPDVVKTLLYRKSFFGGPFNALSQDVMRGPSDWSVGERELFAAFVSRLNQCVF
jgi:hypothetical protein